MKHKTLILFAIVILIFQPFFVSADSIFTPGKTCEGSQLPDGTYIPKGEVREVTIGGVRYRCVGCGDCTPIGSSSSPSLPSGRLSPSKQLTLQMYHSIFQPLFNSLFDFRDIFASSQRDFSFKHKQEEIQKNREKEAIEAWQKHLEEAKRQAELELKKKKEAGESILQRGRIGSGPFGSITIIGPKTSEVQSSLTPLDWNNPRRILTASEGSQVIDEGAKEQLLRAAYFSKMAETALLKGELEAARFWATIAFEDSSISPRAIDYKPPKELLNAIDPSKALEMNRKLTKTSMLFRDALPRFDALELIFKKIEEAKIKKENAERKIKDAEEQIKKIELQNQTTQTLDEKTQINDLLAKAIALKHEAEVEYQKVLNEEQKLNQEKQTLEKDLNELRIKWMEVMK